MMPIRVLVPSGVLGLGFDPAALARGVAAGPDIIAIDGGSTDSGPFYLGTGTSKYSRSVCRDEWRQLLSARAATGVPLVIGSCGTCGSASAVDWMFDITCELVAELGQSLRVARLYSDVAIDELRSARDAGRLSPLDPAPPINDGALAGMTNIVALAGAEQIQAAIDTGADVVLAGRTTDTATIAALPLARGMHAGAAWHGAKIAECGAFCTTRPASGVIMVSFDETGFTVTPMGDGVQCTPQSVAAHMLYENSDPWILHEPGGHLDVTAASYAKAADDGVRVEGAAWVAAPDYRVKLEGARLAGYQTMMLAVIRDPRYVDAVSDWADRLLTHCRELIAASLGLPDDAYDIELRLIGVDSALGGLERHRGSPVEVGVMLLITAASQAVASEIAALINPHLLHYPLTDDEPMPTFAFPMSPVHSDRGAVYEFALNHVLGLNDPMDGFRLRVDEVGHG
jgi:hypothetical protein